MTWTWWGSKLTKCRANDAWRMPQIKCACVDAWGQACAWYHCLNLLKSAAAMRFTLRRVKWSHAHIHHIYSRTLGRMSFEKPCISTCSALTWKVTEIEWIKEMWGRWSRKKERGGEGWRGKLQCYFSPFSLQPHQSLMLWDNSWTPKLCYITFTLFLCHPSSANPFPPLYHASIFLKGFLYLYAPMSATPSVSRPSLEVFIVSSIVSSSFLFQFVYTLWTWLPKWKKT